jgi:hypothetical protein
MRELTRDQRQRYALYLCEMIQEWVAEGDDPFEVEVARGTQWYTDAVTGLRTPRANPTITVVLKINGGAQDTEGPTGVSGTTLFGGPEG